MDTILKYAALILSIINGLILLHNFLRDRPDLKITAIHPEVYQWWFNLPPGEFEGKPTRKRGFIVYVGIGNKGLRSVTVNQWRLHIKLRNGHKEELKPMNLPQPKQEFTGFTKEFPVLGQRGVTFSGDTKVNTGDSISGMSYYILECYGSDQFDPIISNEKIIGTFVVMDVFDKKYSTTIYFSKVNRGKIEKLFGSIEALNHKL